MQGEQTISKVSKTATFAPVSAKTTKTSGLPLTSTNAVPLKSASSTSLRTISQTIQVGQPQYKGLIGTISTITRQEGARALYNGLSAGLQRQMCFASVRLGLYDSVKSVYQNVFHEDPEGFQIFTRILAGLSTGGMAVILAQPTDVVKVRFQAQCRTIDSANKPRYTSTLNAYKTIGRNEGIGGLWKGAYPNIGRNAVVNVSEIVCYDIVKDCLLTYMKMNDNVYCHFTAAIIAGIVNNHKLSKLLSE